MIVSINCLLVNYNGSNLVNKVFLYPTRMSGIRLHRFLKMWSDNKQPITIRKAITSHLQIGGLCIQVWFVVLHNLETDVVLGTSPIIRYMRERFFAEWKVLLWQSPPVAILHPVGKCGNSGTTVSELANVSTTNVTKPAWKVLQNSW